MNSLIYHFNLHVTPNISPPPVLNLGQYDSSRTFVAHLKTERGEPYILTEGIIVQIIGKNKFGPFSVSATYNNDTVTFIPSGKSTLEAGRIYVTMQLEQGDSFLTPLSMIFNIQKAGRDINDNSSEGGSGEGSIIVSPLMITKNGTYTAPSGKAYTPITIDVANSYTTSDEGRVVSNGTLVAQTAHTEVTENGTIDTTLNNSVTINVSQGSGEQLPNYDNGGYVSGQRGSVNGTKMLAINAAINEKTGSTSELTPDAMATAIEGIQTADDGETVWFDDRNNDVKGYLTASESYTDANRSSASVIGQYRNHSVQDQDCPVPFLGRYNLFPNVENEVGAWTVNRFDYTPRMIKLQNVWNVRDIGGWSCDGGKIAYGKIFRGARLDNSSAPATTADLNFLASLGIKLDLDIRDRNNASHAVQIPGADYLNVPITAAYAPMINNEATAAANACKAAMESVVANKPVYIHCASGADRTGCICGMLEAVLGVGARDIDRDYEMTSFADIESLDTVRSGGNWPGFWAALPTSQETAKMNVVKFLRDNGVTTALINSFRRAVINGNPSDVDIQTRSITNNLTGCTTSNAAISVDAGQSYSATITPNSGYTLLTLTVTMGGVDITSTAVDNGVITIATVTGDVVITAFAEAQTSYTNLVRTSEAVDSTAIYNNSTGYKNGYYLDSGDGHESSNASDCMTGCIQYGDGTKTQTDIIYIKGYTGTAGASHTRLCSRNSSKTKISVYTGFLSSNSLFTVESLGTNYYKLTPQTGVFTNVNYLQFSFNQADGSGIIITKNEPIE